MPSDVTAIRAYFKKLGFAPEIADVYLALHAGGPQTMSELSRSSGVERTRLYRLIDALMESHLIELEAHYKRGVLKAAPIANLNILIAQKEQELKSLQDELGLVEQVLARNSLSNPVSRVQFYHGPEGHRQMMWNEARAGTEVLAITHELEQPHSGKIFFERWVEECNKRSTSYREIHGPDFKTSHNTWYATHDNIHLAQYETRFLPPEIFRIHHSTCVYNDVVAHYNWRDGEIFGFEIHNKTIADEQRQIFELLWKQAQPKARS